MNSYLWYVLFCVFLALNSCSVKPKFDERELTLLSQFDKVDTVIYELESSEMRDTIIFLPLKIDTIKYRNPEICFCDEYIMSVAYKLTEGSYHKMLGKNETTPLYFFSVNESYTSRQLSFLGLGFNTGVLEKMLDTSSVMVFDKINASFNGVNINKGIISFKFSKNEGIISFVDEFGELWVRQKK